MSALLDRLLDPERAAVARAHDQATTADALARRMPAPLVSAEERAALLALWHDYERSLATEPCVDATLVLLPSRPRSPIADDDWCITGGIHGSQPILQLQPWVPYHDCGSLDAPAWVPTGGHFAWHVGPWFQVGAERLR